MNPPENDVDLELVSLVEETLEDDPRSSGLRRKHPRRQLGDGAAPPPPSGSGGCPPPPRPAAARPGRMRAGRPRHRGAVRGGAGRGRGPRDDPQRDPRRRPPRRPARQRQRRRRRGAPPRLPRSVPGEPVRRQSAPQAPRGGPRHAAAGGAAPRRRRRRRGRGAAGGDGRFNDGARFDDDLRHSPYADPRLPLADAARATEQREGEAQRAGIPAEHGGWGFRDDWPARNGGGGRPAVD